MSSRDGSFAVLCHIVFSDVIKNIQVGVSGETYIHNIMVREDWIVQIKPNLAIKN